MALEDQFISPHVEEQTRSKLNNICQRPEENMFQFNSYFNILAFNVGNMDQRTQMLPYKIGLIDKIFHEINKTAMAKYIQKHALEAKQIALFVKYHCRSESPAKMEIKPRIPAEQTVNIPKRKVKQKNRMMKMLLVVDSAT